MLYDKSMQVTATIILQEKSSHHLFLVWFWNGSRRQIHNLGFPSRCRQLRNVLLHHCVGFISSRNILQHVSPFVVNASFLHFVSCRRLGNFYKYIWERRRRVYLRQALLPHPFWCSGWTHIHGCRCLGFIRETTEPETKQQNTGPSTAFYGLGSNYNYMASSFSWAVCCTIPTTSPGSWPHQWKRKWRIQSPSWC